MCRIVIETKNITMIFFFKGGVEKKKKERSNIGKVSFIRKVNVQEVSYLCSIE